jgi:selenide,water dikinase
MDSPDDAAVWRLDEERALVATIDFFTPVVDDPYDYGAIAAANSLSDVYAMGGEPFLALNVTAFPPKLPNWVLADILRGSADKAVEAGVVIAGGHTIQDEEPKYGLTVLGFVHPDKMLSKRGARPGDALVLSKPLGFGCTTTALKKGKAEEKHIREAVDWMTRLNRDASRLAVRHGAHAATDVTGFSLLGHGWEMAEASGAGLRLRFADIPFLSGARRYAEDWHFPGGSMDNRLYFGEHVAFSDELEEHEQMLLFDAQTSGGLLLAIPPENLPALLEDAARLEQPLWVVGEVTEGDSIEVV